MRRRLGVDDDDFVLTFCGRVDSLKQPLLALRMFASVQARCASARLLIGGGGEQMSAVKQETESLSLTGRVILTNQVPDTCAYCAASDACFSSSKSEGFSLSAREARRSMQEHFLKATMERPLTAFYTPVFRRTGRAA